MWYLATINDEGNCFGFLKKDMTISNDPDNEKDELLSYKKKADTNEICMKINFSKMLLQNSVGYSFRVAPVKE